MSLTETQQPVENKMGVMPVHKLLLTMALPMMVSMLVQALYNVVDSIFVAKLSEDALTAVSLAFPMQNLMIATATGIGVGMNALLSRKLGEKDFKGANQTAANGVFLSVIAYLLFLFIGAFMTRIFFLGQTDIKHIVEEGTTYLTLICTLSFGIFGQVIFERLLQSTGKTFYAMITQGTGAIINIILDPILIFGLAGFPKMGVAGAAIATVIGQIIAAILALYFNKKVNKEIHVSFRHFRPHKTTIQQILYVGIPSILMVAIGSVMTFGMNRILMAFTSTAAAVFGAYFKLQSFIMMPIFGLNNGMIPIIAYNYGAKKKERITHTIRLSITYAICIMLVGLCILQFFPDTLLGFFDASEHMLAIGVPALKTISLSFVFAGFCIVSSSVFQAFGNGVLSMFVSFARQLIVLLPIAWLFSKTGKLDLIWWAFPIAELMSLTLCVFFLRQTYVKIIKNLS